MIYDELGLKLKDFEHGFQRGIYYADMYENGKLFLRNEIDEKDLVMKKKYVGLHQEYYSKGEVTI